METKKQTTENGTGTQGNEKKTSKLALLKTLILAKKIRRKQRRIEKLWNKVLFMEGEFDKLLEKALKEVQI